MHWSRFIDVGLASPLKFLAIVILCIEVNGPISTQRCTNLDCNFATYNGQRKAVTLEDVHIAAGDARRCVGRYSRSRTSIMVASAIESSSSARTSARRNARNSARKSIARLKILMKSARPPVNSDESLKWPWVATMIMNRGRMKNT